MRGREGELVLEIPALRDSSRRMGVEIEILGDPSPSDLRFPEVATEARVWWSDATDEDVVVDITLRVRLVDRDGDVSEWSEPYHVHDEQTVGCGAAAPLALLPWWMRRRRRQPE